MYTSVPVYDGYFWILQQSINKKTCLFAKLHIEMITWINWDALHGLVAFVQFKNQENTHGGMLVLVKLQAKACNIT